MQINDLTRMQRLSVPCPVCAAAPQEHCCEVRDGAFRQEEHLARLLAAAGLEIPSLLRRAAKRPSVHGISAKAPGICPAN